MLTTNRVWQLDASFSRKDERDTCQAEVLAALTRASGGETATAYATEMTDGSPAVAFQCDTREPLALLLTHVATVYPSRAVALYLTTR